MSTILKLPFIYARYRLGLLSLNQIDGPITPLAGMTVEEIKRLGEETHQASVERDLYSDMENLIVELRRENQRVLLASTTFRFLVEPLAARLGVTDIISTELEISNQRVTGKVLGKPCYAQEKARRVAVYCRTAGIPLSEASFYTDSHHDLPLLQAVRSPVAVNPDLRLAYNARQFGWPILRPA
mgnify:FL=1